MDIETLRELGGFVSPTPVEKEITWTPRNEDGTPQEPVTFTVRIKKLSSGASERLWVEDEKHRDRSSQAALLSESLMLGERFITYEEAFQLEPTLSLRFAIAVNEVNGWGDAAAKNSQPPTSSGTTS